MARIFRLVAKGISTFALTEGGRGVRFAFDWPYPILRMGLLVTHPVKLYFLEIASPQPIFSNEKIANCLWILRAGQSEDIEKNGLDRRLAIFQLATNKRISMETFSDRRRDRLESEACP